MTIQYKNQIDELFFYNITDNRDRFIAYAILGMWKYGLPTQYKLN